MDSHQKLRIAPVALLGVVSIAIVGWLIHLQCQGERAAAYVRAVLQRLAAGAKPIHAMPIQGETLYTCTNKNGWIYAAPTYTELCDVCESHS